ncbi:16S rRNA (guanine(527)-N(7))-methyltransferase RsmG [Haliangium ochraceum]|uniref:Ribosomal RNA small subunit methyltransferase G n=1 Tax=Haliangium ochraceum (strain DSM 14365 / JCM 11303 / SMP-2) TaxID=502025 RepID=D0LVN5_HALO1|nr:16S rRNA (guanine(527)-N(7))-methyltransferase RsmG [Haliangium ochraceum]ACY19353.1 methyltransferase GidB [Haliangium ochraceum DSM 14365]
MSERWLSYLGAADATAGRALSEPERGALCAYLELLAKWNRKINLTGSREPEALAAHVVDCLALLRHIPADAVQAVDVGSGAGLPGAVVAALMPGLEVTALEPIHKKHAFLSAVRRELGLDNLRPLAQRAEEHRDRAGFTAFDLAMSRATLALPAWLKLGQSMVRPGGRVLGMEGLEQFELPEGASRHPYELREGSRQRAIVVWTTPGAVAG